MARWPLAKTEAIHKAVISSDASRLQDLLARKNINVNAVNANGATALHIAAVLDDSNALKALLAHPKTDPNAQEPNGRTPLHLAVSAGSLSAVEVLLGHPRINVNLVDRDGRTPLHCAVNAIITWEDPPDDTSWVRLFGPQPGSVAERSEAANSIAAATLLARTSGVSYGVQDKRKRTPLSWALHLGLADLAMAIIGDREVVPEAALTDSEGNTALHKAVVHIDSDSLVTRLLRGQDRPLFNARNNISETALHVAARSNAFKSFNVLVNAGADLNLHREGDGATPFHVAAQHGSSWCVDILRDLSPIQHDGLFANIKDNDGNTPLHFAAEQDNRLLVNSIFYVYAKTTSAPWRKTVAQVNNKGEAAADVAAACGHVNLTIHLLGNGSIESEADRSRHSETVFKILPLVLDTSIGDAKEREKRVDKLLSSAARCGVLDVLQALQHHASPSMLEDLIVLAAAAGHVHVVQYLVEAGVDPNIGQCSITTELPLATAARHSHVQVMRFLLTLDQVDPNRGKHHGANVKNKDDDDDYAPSHGPTRFVDDTPLMSAIRSRSAAAVSVLLSDELLQSGRLDLNMGNDGEFWRLNPLLLTCFLGYDDMAKLLIRRTYFDRGWLRLDVSNEEGTGPLGLACKEGHWRVAELLLQIRSWPSGLDALRVDAKDDLGRTPFSYACSSPSPETVNWFLESGLIMDGLVDPDSTNKCGMTPLAHACREGQPGTVELLLTSDLVKGGLIEPDSRDVDGMTPLAHACSRGSWNWWCERDRVGAVKLILDSYLLKDGLVNPDARDKGGLTPLAHACADGQWEIVNLFLDYFLRDEPIGVVDFGTVDESGDTLLDLACTKSVLRELRFKTILTLLDNRLIDRGLAEAWRATPCVSEDAQQIYDNIRPEAIERSEVWPVMRRLAELGHPVTFIENPEFPHISQTHVFWCGLEPPVPSE